MFNKRNLQRMKRSIMPIFCLLFTFFGYGPLELYLANKGSEEFWFSFSDVIVPIIIAAIVFFILIMALIVILPSKGYHIIMALLISIGALMFIQGTFLPNSYGQLNGNAIDWSKYNFRLIYNTAIWAVTITVAIIIAIKKWQGFRQFMIYAACILVAVEVVSIAAMYITGAGKSQSGADLSNVFLTREKECTIAGEDNTIVFVLDTFDAELMSDLIDLHPEEIKASFADFTFYRNTSGGATRTKYAIPFILSGRTNDTGESYGNYLREASRSSALFKALRTGAYDTGFYTENAYVDRTQTDAIDNLSSNEKLIPTSQIGLAANYMKLVAFKYMPHILKPVFWMYSFDLLQWKGSSSDVKPYRLNDIDYYNMLKENGLTVDDSKHGFRFFHLVGAHGPFTMDENMQSIPQEEGTEQGQGFGALRIVAEYIKELKANDAYDNANIFILADHGDREYGRSNYEQNPLCMIKVAHASEDFIISDVRLSFESLPGMFVDALGNKLDPENYIQDGTRYFYEAIEANGDYNITEYASDGDAYDVDSWHKTGTVYSCQNKNYSYELGTKLYSGILNDCTAGQHFVRGFATSESSFIWTDGQDAEMRFDIGTVDKNLVFTFDYCSVANGYQRCYLYAGDTLVGSRVTEAPSSQTYIIPKECVEDGTLNIRVWMPDAYCPLEHGTGPDWRTLGLAMQTFTLDLTDEAYDTAAQMQVELPE